MSNVRDFGAVGDGQADDTDALQHALDDGDGVLKLPRGIYRITRPLLVDLAKNSRTGISGSLGTAKIRMEGPGPAIYLKATHGKTADPHSFRPEEWLNERMPIVTQLEIEGGHLEADGIRIEGVMQPTITSVLIREVRDAIRISERARNVLISHCHIYYCTGKGVFFDQANLHQAIVTGSHISYCRLGGIRIEGGQIRNFQITGNDIEYNNNRAHGVADADDVPTAEIYFDVQEGTIREGTIASNTIQATYSPGGANIRFIGASEGVNTKVGMWTITGNLIGSQATNIHLTGARGVTITGNHLYSAHQRNVLVENSQSIVLGDNCFGHNPDYSSDQLCTGLRFVDSRDCTISGLIMQGCDAGHNTVPGAVQTRRLALAEFENCRSMNISGCQFLNGSPDGLTLSNCSDTSIVGCTVLDNRENKLLQTGIRITGQGTGNSIGLCRIAGMSNAAIATEVETPAFGNIIG